MHAASSFRKLLGPSWLLLVLTALYPGLTSAQGALQLSAPTAVDIDSAVADSIIEPKIISIDDLPGAEEEMQRSLTQIDSMIVLLETSAFKPAAPLDSSYWTYPKKGWPKFDKEILVERLGSIPTTIPLQCNSRVKNWIERYTLLNREGVQKMMGLSQIYFPMIEEKLDRREMPHELKHLPIIESAFNTQAVSPVGATGLWQIMYRTGKSLGLRIDTYVDERRDPYEATEAALDYLEDLHAIYGDWLLVVAAYNCGPGNVNKAIRRSGGKRGIWEIYPYLPRETRGYVPAFIAATYTFTYAEEHRLQAWQPKFDYELTDTVQYRQNVKLSVLAEQFGLTTDELKFHNPALRRDFVPGGYDMYPVRLPFSTAMEFAENRDSFMATVDKVEKPVAVTVSNPKPSSATNYYFDKTGYTRLLYTVKSGDNLGYIAGWYDVGVSELKNWNNMYGSGIRIGQKIAVYKKDGVADRYRGLDEMSFNQKQALIGKAVDSSESASSETFWYTIQQGDNLWDIANRHPGNTIESIARLNNISTRTTLKLGSRIKLVR